MGASSSVTFIESLLCARLHANTQHILTYFIFPLLHETGAVNYPHYGNEGSRGIEKSGTP